MALEAACKTALASWADAVPTVITIKASIATRTHSFRVMGPPLTSKSHPLDPPSTHSHAVMLSR